MSLLTVSESSCGDLSQKELVVVLHGLGRTSFSMNGLNKHLQQQGYHTLNINYPSRKKDLESLAEDLHETLQASEAFNKASKVHFVGHSLGGILARVYLNNHGIPENIGNLVMIGSPNKGTEVADHLKDNKIFKKVLGPVAQELTTKSQEKRDKDMPASYKIGIISGSAGWLMPFFSKTILPGDNDGIVSVERSKSTYMDDHIIIPATHTYIMNNKETKKQVVHFLKNGRFNKPAAP